MKSIIYICPKGGDKPTGGIKVIYKHAEILSKLLPKENHCKVVHFEDLNYRCRWFSHNAEFKKNLSFDPDKEFAIIPEWMAVYHAKVLQNLKVEYGIFVQNGFYLYKKPKNKFSDLQIFEAYNKAKFILSCANESTECIKLTFPELKDKIVRVNISVDNVRFYCSEEIFTNKENLITFMPRKKNRDIEILLFILNRFLPKDWSLQGIDNFTEDEVIKYLKKSKIFLSFSELEGLGLPPIESALCGNHVIGYTGQGGKEFWNSPIFDEVIQGDLRTFSTKVLNKVKEFQENNTTFNKIKPYINKLSNSYSLEREETSLVQLVNLIKKF